MESAIVCDVSNNIYEYEIANFSFQEAFENFDYDKDMKDKLLADIISLIKCEKATDIYNSIKNRLPFNIAEAKFNKDKCDKNRTTESFNKDSLENGIIYYNYIIGYSPDKNKIYLRIGSLPNTKIVDYYKENHTCQLEWEAGIKHAILCKNLTILFSGVLIFDLANKNLTVTPSSGQWAINMYLLSNPIIIKPKIEEVYAYIQNPINKENIKKLNSLNILCTCYVLNKQKENEEKLGDINIDGKCFIEYFTKEYNEIISECKDDIPIFKSEKYLLDTIDPILSEKYGIEYRLSLKDLIIKRLPAKKLEEYENAKFYSENGEELDKTQISLRDLLYSTGGIKNIQPYVSGLNKIIKENKEKAEKMSSRKIMKSEDIEEYQSSKIRRKRG